MKKKVLLVLTALLAIGQGAFAYDFSAVAPSGQTLYYNFGGNGVYVTYPGEYSFNVSSCWSGYNKPTGYLNIPSSVIYENNTYIVIGISGFAFFDCNNITSVNIPNTVSSIGQHSFQSCDGLLSVNIPNTVTIIGECAFDGCSGLTSIIIPPSVTYIGPSAFGDCSNLISINIPNTVTSINSYTFQNCSSLSSIIIPNSVNNIGEHAFDYCSGLTTVIIGDSVNSIGTSAFYHCNNLNHIVIPNSVMTIGQYAFGFCSSLTSITIPQSVDSIGSSAFNFCNNLDTIILLSNIPPSISSYPFGYSYSLSGKTFYIQCGKTSDYQSAWGIAYNFSENWLLYSLEVNANQNTRGVANVDNVCGGNTATISATSNYGYHFTHWQDNNIDNPRTVQVTQNKTYTAYFDYNQYTISLDVDTTIHGNVSGSGNYNYLSSRTITATANYGYHFTHWNDGNTDNPRTITLTQDTSFTAFFEKNSYTVTVLSNNNTMGQATGGDTVLYLDSVTISATSNYGYHFTHWQDNNTDNPRTVQVTQNKTYTAYFDYNQYNISLDVDTAIHGNVSGSGNYNYLSSRTITATANPGYHFTHWSDGNTNNPRTITLTQDTSFTAYFEKNSYVVTVLSNNNTMGHATGGDTVLYLDSVTISATSNYGYHFTHWQDNNTDNPRTVQVTQNKTYTAYFDYDQFTLTVQSDNTTQGNVSGSGNYNYLSNRTITATPTYGHHFTYWNDGVTENPRTITLTQDTSFTAHFAPNQYTLTVNASEHGTASGSGTYNFGDTISIQATPEDHYHFTRWNDGNRENPRYIRIEEDITLTAFFAIDTHTVSVTTSDIVRGQVEASGTEFVYGTPCTVTATAYTGYVFAGWSNGVTANPYTFAVISDVELTALFVEEGEEVFTVTVESADPTMGSVSGGGQALNGGTVTISAIPREGFRFLTWNDGNTENPRTVTVTADITYTAYFESTTQGISDIDASSIMVYASDRHIIVRGAEGMEVRVFDVVGREVTQPIRNGETPMLPKGVYLVKVGTMAAKKVVVF